MKFESQTNINDIIKALNSIESAIEDKDSNKNKLFSKEAKEQEHYKALEKNIIEIKKLLSDDKVSSLKNNKSLNDILKKISDSIKKQATLSDIKSSINSLVTILENSQKSNEKILSDLSNVLSSKFNFPVERSGERNVEHNTVINKKTVINKSSSGNGIQNKSVDNILSITKAIDNKFVQLLSTNSEVSNFLSDTNSLLKSREKLEYEKFKLDKFRDKNSSGILSTLSKLSDGFFKGGITGTLGRGVAGILGGTIAGRVLKFLGVGTKATRGAELAAGASKITKAGETAADAGKVVKAGEAVADAGKVVKAGEAVADAGKVVNASEKIAANSGKFAKLTGVLGKSVGAFSKVAGKLAWPLTVLTTGYDAFQGWNNSDKYFGGDKETNSTEKKLASALTNIVDMGGLTTSIFKFFGSDFDTKAVAQKMFGWIDGIQSWWNEKIMPALTKIWESISRIGASIWKVVKPIWETLHTMVNKLFEFGKNVLAVDIEYWSNIISTIGDVLGWLVNTLSSGVEWIAEGFEDFVNVGGEIIEWFKSLPETIMNAIGNLFGVDNLYKTVADTVGGWFNSLIDGVTGYFKEKWPILAKAASSIGSWFSSSDKKEQKEQKEVEEQLVKIKTKTSEVTEDISKGRGAGYGMHNGTRDNALPIEEEAGKLSVAISNKIHYDCSQWVSALLTNMGQEGFVDKNGNALSSKAIKNKLLAKNGGLEKNWKDAKEGDVIYLNDVNGQDYGTTHVAMVYKDPETGELMVTESNGKQGVTTKSYAEYQKLYGNRMHLLNNTDDPSKIQQVAYSTNKQAIDRRYNNNIIGDEKRQEVVVNNINANDNKNINNNNSSNTGGNNITPIMVVNPVPTFSYYGGLNPRV